MPSSLHVRKSSSGGTMDEAKVNALFDQFVAANTFQSITTTFRQLCTELDINQLDHRNFYRRIKAKLTSWKQQSLWKYLDKRAAHKDYRKQTACSNTRLFVIGCGPCGLRMAIEGALLGAKVVVVEKRDRFSRNNVLHLWPFLITDLRNLGAKKFFGKFCAGSLDHISIRTLQCILCKVALLYGCQIHPCTGFEGLVEPPVNQDEKIGWKVKVGPSDSPVNALEFDVLIGADGKRNTLEGFNRKEFRGKLAIAITANFINRHTQAENKVEEISGVAFIFNQKFFKDLNESTGIDLENIVYYKDETHYFVMTAKKTSLLEKGVLHQDCVDTVQLLSRENINQKKLMDYAREAAGWSTTHQLPNLEFALNHYGQPDVAVFDFTSLFQSENACRVIERNGHKILVGIVGDSLLEPFWPTGSGCARGFLGCFDAAWMMKNWTSGRMTPLQVIAERECIFSLLSQTSPENLNKDYNQYTIDPNTRYRNWNKDAIKPFQVRDLYQGDGILIDQIVKAPSKKLKSDYTGVVDSERLLKWCQKQLEPYRDFVRVTDMTSSWKNGLAVCALIHLYRPDLIRFKSLHKNDVSNNNQLAFNAAEKELGISPVMTGQEMAECHVPDKLSVVSYVSQFYELFKNDRPYKSLKSPKSPTNKVPSVKSPRREESRKTKVPEHPPPERPPPRTVTPKTTLLNRLSNKLSKTKRDKKERESIMRMEKSRMVEKHRQMLMEKQQQAELALSSKFEPDKVLKYNNLATKRIAQIDSGDGVEMKQKKFDEIDMQLKEAERMLQKGNLGNLDAGVKGSNKVSAMATALVSKIEKDNKVATPPLLKKTNTAELLAHHQKASEYCYFCKKRVYLMERQSAEGYFFHRHCLKCAYCGSTLRPGAYAFQRSIEGEGKFYCTQHLGMRKRLVRKRSFTDMTDNESKENVPTRRSDGPDMSSLFDIPDIPPIGKPKTPRSLDSLTAAQMRSKKQTPERIEFELSLDESMIEQDEDLLTEHNLRSSMSTENLSDDEDEWTTESEDEDDDDVVLYSSEDEAGAKAQSLKNTAKLVQEWTRRHSTDDLDQLSQEESSDEESEGDSDDEESESEETEDDEFDEAVDDGLVEETPAPPAEPEAKQLKPEVKPEVKPEPRRPRSEVISPSSQEIQRNRMNFFMQAPEPVRIDPRSFFGFDRHPSKITKEKSPEKVIDIDIDGKDTSESKPSEPESENKPVDIVDDDIAMIDENGEERIDGTSSPMYFETEDGIIYENEADIFETDREVKEEPPIAEEEDDLDDSDDGTQSDDEITIDEAFVTSRSDRQRNLSAKLVERGSDSSFTISTPTESVKSYGSSLELDKGASRAEVQEGDQTLTEGDDQQMALTADTGELSERFIDYAIKRDMEVVSDNVASTAASSTKSLDSSLDMEVEFNKDILGSDADTDLSSLCKNDSEQSTSDLSALMVNESIYETPQADSNKARKTSVDSAVRPSELDLRRKTSDALEGASDSQKSDQSDSGSSESPKRKISVDKSALELSLDSNELKNLKKTVNVDADLLLMDSVFKTPSPEEESKLDEDYDMDTGSPPASQQDEFFTPMTSVKTRPEKPIMDTPMTRDAKPAKKRLLPTTPMSVPKRTSEELKKLREIERERLRDKAREKARLKSDAELGVAAGFTPRKLSDTGGRVPLAHRLSDSNTNNKELNLEKEGENLEVETVSKTESEPMEVESKKPSVPQQATVKDTPELAVEKQQKPDVANGKINKNDIDTPMRAAGVKPKDTPELTAEEAGTMNKEQLTKIDSSSDTPLREAGKSSAAKRKEFFDKVATPVRIDPKSMTPPPEKVLTKAAGKQAEKIRDVKPQESIAEAESLPFADESSPDKTPSGETDELKDATPSLSPPTTGDVTPATSTPADSRISTLSRDSGKSPVSPMTSDTTSSEKKEKKGRFRKNKKEKKAKSPESGEGQNADADKKEKRKSWFAMLLSPKNRDKKSESSNKDEATDAATTSVDKKKAETPSTSQSTPSGGKDKKLKTPKSKDKKKDKKKGKGKNVAEEESITDAVKELRLHERPLSITSDEDRQRVAAHVKSMTRRAPKASEDEFTESDSDLLDTDQNGKDLEEAVSERLSRKAQRAARKQQRQQELKRLRMAQEIQRQLEEVEVKHKTMEDKGVGIEKALRGEGTESEADKKPEGELMQEWFNLVHEKNVLVRYESELMVRAKELELEDRHSRLEQALREKMEMDETEKTEQDIEKEKKILEELLDVVEQRDALVTMLEEDRVREKEEDQNLIDVMDRKGFQLSPITYCKSLSKWVLRLVGIFWLLSLVGIFVVHFTSGTVMENPIVVEQRRESVALATGASGGRTVGEWLGSLYAIGSLFQ